MTTVKKTFHGTRFQPVYVEEDGPRWGEELGILEIHEEIEITIDIKKYDNGYRWKTTRTDTTTSISVWYGNIDVKDHEHVVGKPWTRRYEHRTNSDGHGLWYISEDGEHKQCLGTCQYRVHGNTEEKAANWLLWQHSKNL